MRHKLTRSLCSQEKDNLRVHAYFLPAEAEFPQELETCYPDIVLQSALTADNPSVRLWGAEGGKDRVGGSEGARVPANKGEERPPRSALPQYMLLQQDGRQ
eukprot:920844-Rhodomonas_salina.1